MCCQGLYLAMLSSVKQMVPHTLAYKAAQRAADLW